MGQKKPGHPNKGYQHKQKRLSIMLESLFNLVRLRFKTD